MDSFDVVIVGGGFSGTLLAVALLRREPRLRIAVLEKRYPRGCGVAYSTGARFHLLNVPAAGMSAFAEEPEHFLRWARRNCGPTVQPRSFLPRSLYGRYIVELLDQALKFRHGRFEWLQDEAIAFELQNSDPVVHCASGRTLRSHSVVLATGNFPPATPDVPGLGETSKRYFPFAWSPSALENLPPHAEVLLVGSGLTSLDLILALKSKAFRGRIHVVSRHGVMPHRHEETASWPQFWDKNSPRTARGLLHLVRQQVRLAEEQGINWRSVIDALRPVTPKIWQSLPAVERKRFLRHARPYWEVHRHRIAPEIADVLRDLQDDKQVLIYAGRVVRYQEIRNHAKVTFVNRSPGHSHLLRVDRVINCTGSENDCRRIDDGLISSLFMQGLARPDELFLGVDADDSGALLDSKGNRSESLFTIGPPRKGGLWETTAVPEIREQISRLAGQLLEIYRHETRLVDSAVVA